MEMKKFVGLGIIAGIIGGCLTFGAIYAVTKQGIPGSTNIKPLQVVDSQGAYGLQNAFVQVAKMVKPAVVMITTEKTVTYRYWNPFGDDFFDQFFEDFGFPRPRQQQPKTFKKKQEGLGSGFIVDEEGYILTNNHVIQGVDRILVKLMNDEKKYEAKIIGTDSRTDLALIKINAARKLPTVILGDSDAIEIGEWAIAIGNPMGLEETITVGVISAKGRSVLGTSPYEDFIQTDAAINPGNSGGPLVNIKGEVIGINTAIIAPYVAQNIGFAIPINIAKKVFRELKSTGKVTRGFLGVYLQPLTEELASSFGLKETKGSLVSDVMPDTPAEKAGLKPGDIILEFNGRPVAEPKDLQKMVADAKVGETVTLTVWRDKKKISVQIKIAERPEEETIAKSESEPSQKTWRGLQVSDITEEMRKQFNISASVKGVIVINVEPGSPADECEITTGTIIRKINEWPVSSIKEFQSIISKIDKKSSVTLWVQQEGNNRFCILKGE
ncbi:MAG TPA: DegQ family serine endoprotease [bacterium]|nr:DegQ family serine endoprotease [bacterium]HOL34261.1 DegQ family serine endoprotease [bacterium]HPP07684.1 DegQ family serine endoprotease [bacterium]